MKKIVGGILAFLLIAAGLVGLSAPAQAGGDHNEDKITICHATGSEKNPYNKIRVSVNAFYQSGHIDDEGDIFPAGKFEKHGKWIEWAAQGDQSILANDCEKPKPVDWNWTYSVSCDAVYGTNPNGAFDSVDSNLRLKNLVTGEVRTFNYHPNTSGPASFNFGFRTHYGVPSAWTHYEVQWVQVNGTNYHWQGSLVCGERPKPVQPPALSDTESQQIGPVCAEPADGTAVTLHQERTWTQEYVWDAGSWSWVLGQKTYSDWTTVSTESVEDVTCRPAQPEPKVRVKDTLVCKDGVWVHDRYETAFIWKDGQWVLGKEKWVGKSTSEATAVECGYLPTTRTKVTTLCKDDINVTDYYVTTWTYDRSKKTWVKSESWSHKERTPLTDEQRDACAGDRPEDSVITSEWVDDNWTCDDTEVTQTRTVTTTEFVREYTPKVGWSWVPGASTTVTETGTRALTPDEAESCIPEEPEDPTDEPTVPEEPTETPTVPEEPTTPVEEPTVPEEPTTPVEEPEEPTEEPSNTSSRFLLAEYESETLAETGVSIGGLLVAALILLVGGGLIASAVTRRRG